MGHGGSNVVNNSSSNVSADLQELHSMPRAAAANTSAPATSMYLTACTGCDRAVI